MATITHGDGIRTDVSSRSAPTIKDDAKFSKIVSVSATEALIKLLNDGWKFIAAAPLIAVILLVDPLKKKVFPACIYG